MLGRIQSFLIAVVAAVGFMFGVYHLGKRDQREKDRVEDMETYIETRKEIDDVEVSTDRDAAVDRLRDNGWTR